MCQKHNLMIVVLFLSIILLFCNAIQNSPRHILDLSGAWQFQLDPENSGMDQKWFMQDLDDSILLPGSLDENQKGDLNTDTTEYHLNRIYKYTGAAWFRKEIVIPADWEGKQIELMMERTKVSHVWLDSIDLGTNNTIFSDQMYDLSKVAKPGRHMLTIQINNDMDLVPVAGSHAYSEDTQTNWHGILGRFHLEASNPVRMTSVRVYPDIHNKEVAVRIKLNNPELTLKTGTLEFMAKSWNSASTHNVPSKSMNIALSSVDTTFEITYSIGEKMQLWSEFDPALYQLTATLKDNQKVLDQQIVDFGMREFKTKGTQFSINGLITFLRGKHEACVFPLTGYPPMEKEGWIRVFRIAHEYGLNHYRYHSWCPPRAAFEAADICGIYMQPELPIWYAFKVDDPQHMAFMMKEGYGIMDAYGNHPSFTMFALGNEIWQERSVLKKMIADFRAYDGRHLYAQGSNNRGGDPSQAEGDDFWVSFRTAREKEDCSMDVRASISFLDSKEGGILNTLPPSTSRNYENAIAHASIPVVGHEIGQYQTYPNYDLELSKYTGVVRPWNLLEFRDRLEKNHMLDQVEDFFKASGALSVLCYREDIEIAIRTPGFGGFQLLDLQDFPGQGTALVGLLDAFMASKGLIAPSEFRQFCDEIVLLVNMDKRAWENNETFSAKIQIANYSPALLNPSIVHWQMISENGNILAEENLKIASVKQGGLTSAGNISVDLSDLKTAQKYSIHLKLKSTDIQTTYPLWVYPADLGVQIPTNIKIESRLSADVFKQLEKGGKVLLFPDIAKIKGKFLGGQFISEFWNYNMFTSLAEQFHGQKSIGTMGILTDPTHPIFQEFPTEFHTNWQWWPIIKASHPIILDQTDVDYRPIVQVIDNINRNHKLGLIFEYHVGSGKLLICAADLLAIQDQPQGRQLYHSILNYMDSEAFDPQEEISKEALGEIL